MATIQQISARFFGAAIELNAQKTKLMQRIVLTVESNAKRVTPVLTGNLRRSINSRVESGGERGVVGTNVNYARFVHDGTKRMGARPFLTDGLAASRDSIDGFLNDAGEEIINTIARGV